MRAGSRHVACVLTVLLVLSSVGTALEGQQEVRRRGFWVGFGMGSGWNISQGLDNETRPGFSAYLRFGGTVHPNVLLGFETLGWARRDGDLIVMRGNVTFSALFYPRQTGGFYLKPGIGFSSLSSSVVLGDRTLTETETGFGGTLGIGHDLQLGKIPLTLGADWLFQLFDAGQNLATTNTLLLFTLGLAWH